MAIRSEEITSVIQKQLEGFEGKLELSEVGYVLSAGDGIARIYGLKKALSGELLELAQQRVRHGHESGDRYRLLRAFWRGPPY